MELKETFEKSKAAARFLTTTSENQRNDVILLLADILDRSHELILEANRKDLEKMDPQNPLYDRLLLSDKRLDEIAADLRNVAALPSPIGEIIEERTLPNGILLQKVRVPFGVVGIIYEARPNVTFDVFALNLKSGNASVLKGGKDADFSNKAILTLIHEALKGCSFPNDCCVLMPPTHEATAQLLNAVGYIDVCIPRGGKNLIDFVRDNAKIPVIETGAGVVHLYFDKDGDVKMATRIIDNAKTRRVSVCNALDTLLIHSDRIKDLEEILQPLAQKKVEIHADEKVYEELKKFYPQDLLKSASPEDRGKEWMDMILGVYEVNSLDEAVNHINSYGSGHSESIVTDNENTAEEFKKRVDASCVYINLPTSFTDGAQFGLGAEIGISTQKLGPRGPMGLKEITTYKYILSGQGQTRPK